MIIVMSGDICEVVDIYSQKSRTHQKVVHVVGRTVEGKRRFGMLPANSRVDVPSEARLLELKEKCEMGLGEEEM